MMMMMVVVVVVVVETQAFWGVNPCLSTFRPNQFCYLNVTIK
jgi:hypothetical protein